MSQSGNNEIMKKIWARSCQYALHDEPWRDLGFKRRPKYGAFFQRFRSKWKVELETKVGNELISIFCSVYFAAGILQKTQLDEHVLLFTSYASQNRGVLRSMEFDTPDDLVAFFRESIVTYINTPTKEWHIPFLSRCKVDTVPIKVHAKLVVGAIRFGEIIEAMIVNKEPLFSSVGIVPVEQSPT